MGENPADNSGAPVMSKTNRYIFRKNAGFFSISGLFGVAASKIIWARLPANI